MGFHVLVHKDPPAFCARSLGAPLVRFRCRKGFCKVVAKKVCQEHVTQRSGKKQGMDGQVYGEGYYQAFVLGISTFLISSYPAAAMVMDSMSLRERDLALVGGILMAATGGFFSIIQKLFKDFQEATLNKKAQERHQQFLDKQKEQEEPKEIESQATVESEQIETVESTDESTEAVKLPQTTDVETVVEDSPSEQLTDTSAAAPQEQPQKIENQQAPDEQQSESEEQQIVETKAEEQTQITEEPQAQLNDAQEEPAAQQEQEQEQEQIVESVASEAKSRESVENGHSSLDGTKIQIKYISGWEKAILHGSLDGGDWDNLKISENPEAEKTFELDISNTSKTQDSPILEFVLTNGAGDWDRDCSGNNYQIYSPGKYVIQNGVVSEDN
eukprot:TRINITY_DN4295_c0_g1_i1.p1 TRINITY_DN4295_c0_g1~~TRINITY_DN4295_c0_g1_i1.p1  ORF type:complete len:386 (+),score=61.49 TRINITY_DN4295_c0_g1_i1:139-1296(+)